MNLLVINPEALTKANDIPFGCGRDGFLSFSPGRFAVLD